MVDAQTNRQTGLPDKLTGLAIRGKYLVSDQTGNNKTVTRINLAIPFDAYEGRLRNNFISIMNNVHVCYYYVRSCKCNRLKIYVCMPIFAVY